MAKGRGCQLTALRKQPKFSSLQQCGASKHLPYESAHCDLPPSSTGQKCGHAGGEGGCMLRNSQSHTSSLHCQSPGTQMAQPNGLPRLPDFRRQTSPGFSQHLDCKQLIPGRSCVHGGGGGMGGEGGLKQPLSVPHAAQSVSWQVSLEHQCRHARKLGSSWRLLQWCSSPQPLHSSIPQVNWLHQP